MATGNSTKTARSEVDAVIKGGSWPGESFLLGTFITLPKGVRVSLYVLLTLVLIYTQLLLPSLLTGRLINDSDQDVVLPGSVVYWVNNHKSISVIDDKTGSWSIPLFSKLPRSLKIEIKILNSRTKTISIPFSTIVLSRFSADPIEIRAKRLAGSSNVDNFDLTVVASQSARWAPLLPIPSAQAQGASAANRASITSKLPEEVIQIVRRISKNAAVRPEDEVEKVLPSAFDQAALLHGIQASYGIHFPSSALETSKTIEWLTQEAIRTAALQSKVVALLMTAIPKYQQKNDIWSGDRPPPADRLETFYAAHGAVPNAEKVSLPIAFFDATLMGSGTEGMLFGKTGVYYRTEWTVRKGPRSGFIPYSEFPSRQFNKAGYYEVSLDRDQNFVTAGSGVRPERLLELLSEIQRAVIAAAK
jgi:hypothetical protein